MTFPAPLSQNVKFQILTNYLINVDSAGGRLHLCFMSPLTFFSRLLDCLFFYLFRNTIPVENLDVSNLWLLSDSLDFLAFLVCSRFVWSGCDEP